MSGAARVRRWTAAGISMVVLVGCAAAPPPSAPVDDSRWWWGVTVDDTSGLDAVVAAVSALPARPVVRVVFDVDRSADSYREAVRRLAAVSTVLGLVVDSSDVAGLSTEQYLQRFESYVGVLGGDVRLWEIGNEINGEWLGPAAGVTARVVGADRIVRRHGAEPVLTLYDNRSCIDDPGHEMLTWADRELDPDFRASVPYVLVSHYPDLCSGRWPTREAWQDTFDQVGRLFPRARWGIGETSVVDANGDDPPGRVDRKTALVDDCYRLSVPDERYLGGCFWWYFAEDAVPSTSSPVWSALAAAVAAGPGR